MLKQQQKRNLRGFKVNGAEIFYADLRLATTQITFKVFRKFVCLHLDKSKFRRYLIQYLTKIFLDLIGLHCGIVFLDARRTCALNQKLHAISILIFNSCGQCNFSDYFSRKIFLCKNKLKLFEQSDLCSESSETAE